MTVRRAVLADAAAIAGIEAAAAAAPWSYDQLCRSLTRATTTVWVTGEPLVGHLVTTSVLDEAEILTIAVHPGHRRQGHADRMLYAAQAHWAADGVRTAWLEVRLDNTAARGLYLRHGWVDVDVRSRYYADGSDAARMRWEAP